jgi:hypothetical protein
MLIALPSYTLEYFYLIDGGGKVSIYEFTREAGWLRINCRGESFKCYVLRSAYYQLVIFFNVGLERNGFSFVLCCWACRIKAGGLFALLVGLLGCWLFVSAGNDNIRHKSTTSLALQMSITIATKSKAQEKGIDEIQ